MLSNCPNAALVCRNPYMHALPFSIMHLHSRMAPPSHPDSSCSTTVTGQTTQRPLRCHLAVSWVCGSASLPDLDTFDFLSAMATKIWMALLVGLVCRWHGAVASAIELVGPKSLWITSPSDVPLLQWLQSVQVDTIEWSGVPLSAVADRSGGGTVSTETDTSPHTVLVTSFLLPRALSPAYLSLSGISQCDIFVFNASVLTTLPPALLLDVDPSDAALLQPALVRLHSGLNFLAIIFWKDSIAGKDLLSVSLTVPDDGARDLVAAGTQGSPTASPFPISLCTFLSFDRVLSPSQSAPP